MCNFKINEQVVCIDTFEDPSNAPIIGEAVTIKGFDEEDGKSYIILYEYMYDTGCVEQAFIIDKFDKLVPKQLLINKKQETEQPK